MAFNAVRMTRCFHVRHSHVPRDPSAPISASSSPRPCRRPLAAIFSRGTSITSSSDHRDHLLLLLILLLAYGSVLIPSSWGKRIWVERTKRQVKGLLFFVLQSSSLTYPSFCGASAPGSGSRAPDLGLGSRDEHLAANDPLPLSRLHSTNMGLKRIPRFSDVR